MFSRTQAVPDMFSRTQAVPDTSARTQAVPDTSARTQAVPDPSPRTQAVPDRSARTQAWWPLPGGRVRRLAAAWADPDLSGPGHVRTRTCPDPDMSGPGYGPRSLYNTQKKSQTS